MFILCRGDMAKEPYIVPVTEVPVYSLEEMCYYVYNNIYSVTEEFFDKKLVEWLSRQVHVKPLAKKMRVLMERHNDLKDFVVTLLCSCDYYKEDEVRKLVAVMEDIANLPPHKKNKIKADNYLKAGKYGKSLLEYKKLLYGEAAAKFSPEEYGDLLHNQAIALFYVSSFEEAARGFREAYARNQREESRNQYLYALLLVGQEEQFAKECMGFEMQPDEIEKLKHDYCVLREGIREKEEEYDFIEKCKTELRASYSGTEV